MLPSNPHNVEFEKLPTSVQQFLLANYDAIEAIDAEVAQLENEQRQLEEKEQYALQAQMPVKGIRNSITRAGTKIGRLQRARKAYQEGYLEIPDLNRRARRIPHSGEDSSNWNQTLPTSAPVRVFRAVAKAVAGNTFEDLLIYDQTSEGDPIVAGVIGSRRFFVTGWR